MLEQRRRSFDVDRYWQRHAFLVARREQDLQVLDSKGSVADHAHRQTNGKASG
jgi:hypothetical protein